MLNLEEAKKRAINFLNKSINQSWSPKPDDNDPLRFEAVIYLANKGIINKSEWTDKIKNIWDSWIINNAIFSASTSYFWPAIKEYRDPAADSNNIEGFQSGFNIENHLSMFRTQEAFSIPGYARAFEQAKLELREILLSISIDFPYEVTRLIWQIVRSPYLRKILKGSILAAAQRIIADNWDIDNHCYNIGSEILFLLNANQGDYQYQYQFRSLFLTDIPEQPKDGSDYEDVLLTCINICSLHLRGIILSEDAFKSAIVWLLKMQKENGSWQYLGINEHSIIKNIENA
jgi:hypothetical protein